MLEFVQGNLLDAEVEALVNTVNTVGVMGKGIALQFKRAFPEIVKPYERACRSGELEIGAVLTVEVAMLGKPRYVINFPTKKHWKDSSRLKYVQSGLQALSREIRRLGIKSIAVPPLGCGLGGLEWSQVKQEIEASLGDMAEVRILVFEPTGAPGAPNAREAIAKPKMTPGRAGLLDLMRRYLAGNMDDSITLLELHKLMYFLREAGGAPKLNFVKGIYGPYSPNLRHVLNDLEGHYIAGFKDATEEPGKVIHLCAGAIEEAARFLSSDSGAMRSLERVEELVDGFETPFGMELLASVHWVARYEERQAPTASEAVQQIAQWNSRKQQLFTAEHMQLAWDRLSGLGWLSKPLSATC